MKSESREPVARSPVFVEQILPEFSSKKHVRNSESRHSQPMINSQTRNSQSRHLSQNSQSRNSLIQETPETNSEVTKINDMLVTQTRRADNLFNELEHTKFELLRKENLEREIPKLEEINQAVKLQNGRLSLQVQGGFAKISRKSL